MKVHVKPKQVVHVQTFQAHRERAMLTLALFAWCDPAVQNVNALAHQILWAEQAVALVYSNHPNLCRKCPPRRSAVAETIAGWAEGLDPKQLHSFAVAVEVALQDRAEALRAQRESDEHNAPDEQSDPAPDVVVAPRAEPTARVARWHEVACPTCPATTDQACVTKKGTPLKRKFHPQRKVYADAQAVPA